MSASDEGKIAWYPSKDGEGSFGQQIVIDREFGGTADQVVTLDLDADGDDDILASIYSRYDNEGRDAFNYSLVWYENTNGLGSFSDRKTIASARNGSWSFIQATDVDGDGDFDLMAKLGQGIVWYEHLDVVGQFSEAKSIVDGGTQSRYSSVNAADMDGDGDTDAVVAKYADRPEYAGSVEWYENTTDEGRLARTRASS